MWKDFLKIMQILLKSTYFISLFINIDIFVHRTKLATYFIDIHNKQFK